MQEGSCMKTQYFAYVPLPLDLLYFTTAYSTPLWDINHIYQKRLLTKYILPSLAASTKAFRQDREGAGATPPKSTYK
ncbi:unnamed protein product [Sphagnum jensenii]|uniref:Uncharacterized protein n=1 Tax=Sphagnum jensenii TaxID=128206 RepID=A0ABP1B4Y6_9BRYO